MAYLDQVPETCPLKFGQGENYRFTVTLPFLVADCTFLIYIDTEADPLNFTVTPSGDYVITVELTPTDTEKLKRGSYEWHFFITKSRYKREYVTGTVEVF